MTFLVAQGGLYMTIILSALVSISSRTANPFIMVIVVALQAYTIPRLECKHCLQVFFQWLIIQSCSHNSCSVRREVINCQCPPYLYFFSAFSAWSRIALFLSLYAMHISHSFYLCVYIPALMPVLCYASNNHVLGWSRPLLTLLLIVHACSRFFYISGIDDNSCTLVFRHSYAGDTALDVSIMSDHNLNELLKA